MSEKQTSYEKSPPKVFIRTFGCQMNERDSELIMDMLAEKGYEATDDPEEADVILFNTCSVRQHAEDRVTGNLQKLKSRRKKDPDLRIGVLGCMAKRHGEMLLKEYPQVDLVVGASNVYEVPELLERTMSGEKVVAAGLDKRPRKNSVQDSRKDIFSAYVNIMYGCDNYCSYCIVPHVRGREVSRPMRDIIGEIRLLAERGVREVTLLGQNVNSYRSSGKRFPALLEKVNEVKEIERIRFTTSHPRDAGKELFRVMRDLDKVCEHIHLPLQSGSDKVLDLMNRQYTLDEYRRKVDLFREMLPEAGLSTDIIVGFPSEKDRDYRATKKAIEEIRYNSAFIFKYSPRPPALSSCMVDDVPEDVKKTRNNELLAVQKKISAEKCKTMIGRQVEVLVEGRSRMSDEEVMGRTRDNTPCVFPGHADLIGGIAKVKIKGSSPTTLKGIASEGCI